MVNDLANKQDCGIIILHYLPFGQRLIDKYKIYKIF